MSKGHLILPQDPEFKALLQNTPEALKKASGDFSLEGVSDMSASDIDWQVTAYSWAVIRHAIIEQTDVLSKIVFHFTRISKKKMGEVSELLHKELTQRIRPKALIQAGESPIYRDQWDLMLFHVPALEAPMLRHGILHMIEKLNA